MLQVGQNYRLRRSSSGFRSNMRSGFSLIELLVVIAIIGILLAISVPALQKTRESARITQCKNHLKQHGTALQNYESQFGHLPKDDENGWGVGVFLLPQLDQSPLYEKLQPLTQTLAVGASADPGSTGVTLEVFRCPSFSGENLTPISFGRSNYLGTSELFSEENLLTDIYDGESNTIAFGETVTDHAWALPGLGTCDSIPNDDGSYGSMHIGGANFVMCDGAVRFITDSIDSETFQALCTLAGSETVGEF